MSHPTADHSTNTAPARGQDLNLPVIGLITVVGGITIFVIIVLIQAWYFSQLDQELANKSRGQVNQSLMDLNFQQQKNLETYRWVDQSKGIVAIPMDRAMELYIARHNAAAATQPKP